MTRQTTLASCFSRSSRREPIYQGSSRNGDADRSHNRTHKKMNPMYHLKLTRVKHRIIEVSEGDETEEDVWVNGKLVAYDGHSDTPYIIELIDDQDGEKRTVQWNDGQMEWGVKVQQYVGQPVAWWFNPGPKLYFGKVTDAFIDDEGTELFHILYDDGDKEDVEWDTLQEALKLHRNRKKKRKKVAKKHKPEANTRDKAAPTTQTATTKSGRKTNPKPMYAEYDDDDEDGLLESDEATLPPKRAKRGKEGGRAGGMSSTKKNNQDSSSEFGENDMADEESDADAMECDTEEDSDGYREKSGKKASKKPTAKKVGKKEKTKPVAATTSRKPASNSIKALCAEKAKDIKVLNNPQKLPDDGPYVEPVGVDATDGIVEGIIGGMVKKVGKLLLKAFEQDDIARETGELNFPIKLNTACSGTDAPSIALALVKESMDRFMSHQHGFEYEHNMSCEIEPFKQAYIGRNFPGVLLFPDITKLTEKETVVDVYGREQSIPEGNLFVAGTSCKDFSMLKSSNRKGDYKLSDPKIRDERRDVITDSFPFTIYAYTNNRY